MASFTSELAGEIWDQSPHTWKDLRQTLQSHPDRFSNLSPELRNRLCSLAEDMALKENGFPNSPQNLYEVLAEQLGPALRPSQ